MEEIPEHDLEGQKITRSRNVGDFELKKGQKVDE